MHKQWLAMLVGLIGLFFVVNAQANLLTDSAALDRVYIPALAVTSQGKLEASRHAMERLHRGWRIFSRAHLKDFPTDPSWRSGFMDISQWIARADGVIRRGKKLNEAHEDLEHIRVILMRVRIKHGIDYFPDYLTAYHDPMEKIVLAAKGKTPATLTATDLNAIHKTLPLLERHWHAITQARFVPAELGLDKSQVAQVRQALAVESGAIAALQRALAKGDKAAIIRRAVAIKPPFAELYMLFGDFRS